MSATASPSLKFPHQPVEIVHKPKPTALTDRSVFLYVRKRIRLSLNVQRLTLNAQRSIKLDVERWASDVERLSVIDKSKAALLIVAHGSTVNPDSSAPTLAHVAEIRRRKIFAEVECAFWKEEPSLRDAIFLFDPESIRHICVVPNFVSEGYFTHTVVPRELELNGRITKRSNGQAWKYCEPVGNHPLMTDLLLRRAHDVAPDVDPAKTSLLIVAHGTDLNENSAAAAKREAEKIRARGKYAATLNVYMEEAPLVSDWKKLTQTT